MGDDGEILDAHRGGSERSLESPEGIGDRGRSSREKWVPSITLRLSRDFLSRRGGKEIGVP